MTLIDERSSPIDIFGLLILLLKIRTAIDDIEAGFVIGSGQQQVA